MNMKFKSEKEIKGGDKVEAIKAAMLICEKHKELVKEKLSDVIKSEEFESFIKDLKPDTEEGEVSNSNPGVIAFGLTDMGKKITESLKELHDKEMITMNLVADFVSEKMSDVLDTESVTLFLMISQKVFNTVDDEDPGDLSMDKRDLFIEHFGGTMHNLHSEIAHKVLRVCHRELFGEDKTENVSIH